MEYELQIRFKVSCKTWILFKGFQIFLRNYKLDPLLQLKDYPLEKDLEAYIKQFGAKNTHLANKTDVKGVAAAFVSNCNSVSKREKVINLLKM